MKNFTPSYQYKYQDTCKKIVGIINNSIINEFACTVEFWFRYYIKIGQKHV